MRPSWFSYVGGLALVAMLSVPASADEPTLYAFHATWCGPCQQMAPVVAKLEADGYRVRHVDIDQERSLAQKHRVLSVPTFLVINATGRVIDRVEGIQPIARLKQFLGRPAGQQRIPLVGAEGRNVYWDPQQPAARPGPLAFGYCEPVQAYRAVVRIRCALTAGSDLGSGCIVRTDEGRIVIASCWHILRDRPRNVECYTAQRKEPYLLSMLAYDEPWDVTVWHSKLLEIEYAKTDIPMRMAPRDAEVGETLWTAGYGGSDTRLAANKGTVIRLGSNRPQSDQNDWMVISGYARPGDSGGPVFDNDVQFAGVLWGSEPGDRIVPAVQISRVRQVIEEASTRLPAVPALNPEPRTP
ncbi:MAG: thioredoxin domain-containing protein, partial [Planctomycetota bacterium]